MSKLSDLNLKKQSIFALEATQTKVSKPRNRKQKTFEKLLSEKKTCKSGHLIAKITGKHRKHMHLR